MKSKSLFVLTIIIIVIHTTGFGAPKVDSKSKISKEEYEIYSIIFDKIFVGNTVNLDTRAKTKILVVKGYTVKDFSPLTGRYLENIKGMLPELLFETASAFTEANAKQEYPLTKSLNLKQNYTIIEKSDIEKTFKHGTEMGEQTEWKEFYKEFPDSYGIVGISRVGFNPAKNQALVYFEYWCNFLCGTGHYVLLNKEQDNWKFLKGFIPWVS